MANPTMLYKCPGEHQIHGGNFDYCIVDADEENAVEDALADGWHLTTPEAREAYEAEQLELAKGNTPAPRASRSRAAAPASGEGEGSAPAGAWGAAAPASGA